MADDLSLCGINEFQGGYSPYTGVENEEVVSQGKQVQVFGIEDSGGGLHSANMAETRVHLLEDQQQTILDNWMQKGLHHNTQANGMPLLVLSIFEAKKHGKLPNLISEPSEPVKLNPYPSFTDSFELLSYYGRGKEKSRDENLNNLSSKATESDRKLSTEEIIRVAGERYIQLSNKKLDGITTFIHPYGSALSSLSTEESKKLEAQIYMIMVVSEIEASDNSPSFVNRFIEALFFYSA